MTEQTNADLIAEAREAAKRADWYMTGESPLLRALADALEAAEQERDEARKAAEDHVLDADAVYVRLSAELREVNQERDALAVVVEKARAYAESIPRTRDRDVNPGLSNRSWLTAQDVLGSLAPAPADALREVKAEAWDEGHDAGWEDRHQDALAGWMTSGPHESEAVNPYRGEQDRD